MTVQHLTEKEIQQYATDRLSCETTVTKHLESCKYCDARVASYQLVFSAIHRLPIPVNDFDLSSLVVSRIKHEKKNYSRVDLLVYLLFFAAVVFTGMMFYSFRAYFFLVVADFSGMGIYLLATTVFALLLFQAIDNYKKYQRKIEALNVE